jgi:hypothetical protein
MLKQYIGQDLSAFDKRLLKGFYVADACELRHDTKNDCDDIKDASFIFAKAVMQRYDPDKKRRELGLGKIETLSTGQAVTESE